jgi:hypothetical protein
MESNLHFERGRNRFLNLEKITKVKLKALIIAKNRLKSIPRETPKLFKTSKPRFKVF